MSKTSILVAAAIAWAIAGVALAQDGSAAEARVTAAQAVYQQAQADYTTGMGTLEHLVTWSVRWRDALSEARPAEAASAASAHLERMEALQGQVSGRVAQGLETPIAALAMTYHVADARLALEKLTPTGTHPN